MLASMGVVDFGCMFWGSGDRGEIESALCVCACVCLHVELVLFQLRTTLTLCAAAVCCVILACLVDQVLGVVGGTVGLFEQSTVDITDDLLDSYRNQVCTPYHATISCHAMSGYNEPQIRQCPKTKDCCNTFAWCCLSYALGQQ